MRPTVLFLLASMLFSAAPSWAAKIVNVRVGQHPDYDRIVFDLDGWAAYQVHSIADNQIVVRVLATSEALEITPSKGLIRSVRLTPSAQSSEVAIQLTDAHIRVKDMMLQSPSRIVIDIRREKPVAEAPAPRAEAPPAQAVPKVSVPEPVPMPVAQPAVKKLADAPVPAPAPPDQEAVPERLQPPPVAREVVEQASPVAAPAEQTPPAVARQPVPAPAPEATPKRVAKKRAPAPAPAPRGSASTFGNRKLFAAGALILLVGIGGLLWWRRQIPEDVVEEESIDGDWFGTEAPADQSDELPMPIEDTDTTLPISAEEAETQRADSTVDDEMVGEAEAGFVEGIVEPEGVAADDGDAIDLSRPMGAASPSAPLSEFQVLQQRLAKMESRIAEMEEARERIDQQAVNQTEELRVQRAAIARTQRVLRNLTRPEDDVATEPVSKE